MTVVGIVAEGTNDFPVIAAFLTSELPGRYGRPIVIKHLQPYADATTGQYRGGGWGRVLGWCKGACGDNIETYFTAVEDGDVVCDLIVVQLDGDALEQCAHHSVTPLPKLPCSVMDRVATLRAMTLEWLAPPDKWISRLRFAFPTMHSEAWLLAGLKPDEANWEAIDDAKAPFRALKPAKTSVAKFYNAQAQHVATKADVVQRQCVSFAAFRNELQP